MDLNSLATMVAENAAIRRRQRLQPAGGKGDKIFPPTYPGEGRNAPPRHVYERRMVGEKQLWCALVDSVQSQANRLEECLQAAIDEGLPVPYVFVDFDGRGLTGISRITSLEAPHRVYDAILRDSLLDGQPFMQSALGRRLTEAKLEDASALLETSPTSLLFGVWHSTGEGGGLGAKFARCLTSEIVAVGVPVDVSADERRRELDVVTAARRTGSRIDPLGVLSSVTIYRTPEDDWTPDADQAERDGKGQPILYARKQGGKAGKPSVINHGNVTPTVDKLGVTCDYVEHCFVLSLAGVRRLRFGGDASRDSAGRVLLAALGVVSLLEQDARGYALRSRCDLVCESPAPLETVAPDGSTSPIEVNREQARKMYEEAHRSAEHAGLRLQSSPIALTPQDKLVEIVRASQDRALQGAGGEAEEEGADAS